MAATITAAGYPDDVSLTTAWMASGTNFFLDALAGLSDAELDEPSPLPDWQRRHVCAHLARNAEGLGRLLNWAATGIETPMYPSPEARAAGIEASAGQDSTALRADVVATAATLAEQANLLTADAWAATVRTQRGTITASIVPWFRCREVWIHAVDLGAGVGFPDIPADVCAALVTELTTGLAARGQVDVVLDSGTHRWSVGSGAIVIEADVHELAAWLTGRATRPELELPPWL